jgi:DnaD/phage-associated family protein
VEIRLNMGKYSSFLAVPAEVVDKHLAAASGMYIKVLLAVLRANEADTSRIAGMLSVPESEVVEAVRYWVQNGIFQEEGVQHRKEKEAPSPARKRPEVVVSAQSLTPGEIQERVEQNQDVRFLFSMAESIFGNLLTSTQQRGLIYIHETLGLPVDVIVMALQYCVSIGKGNFAYIQKLCGGWADQEINTHARAEEYIRQQTMRHTREREVQERFGIKDRALSAQQLRYIQGWYDQLGYGIDMIGEAYERTLNAINQLSFPYINTILNSWHEKGIRTPQEIALKDARPAGKGGQAGGGQRRTASYDLEEFERRGFEIPKIEG